MAKLYVALSRAQNDLISCASRNHVDCLFLGIELTAFVSNITFPAFVKAATDYDLSSPPLPPPHINFIGSTLLAGILDAECDAPNAEWDVPGVPQQAEPRELDLVVNGGCLEAKGLRT